MKITIKNIPENLTKTLTFDEIKKTPGVYRSTKNSSFLITLQFTNECKTFWVGDSMALTAADAGWSKHYFIKIEGAAIMLTF